MLRETLKICSCCKIPQAISAFHRHKNTADGHTNQCKACCKARKKRYYAAHGAKVRTTVAQYKLLHPEKVKARHNKYYSLNKEVIHQRNRDRRLQHLESTREKDRQRYSKNRLHRIQTYKRWVQANPDKLHAQRQKHYKQHGETIRKKSAAFRAKNPTYQKEYRQSHPEIFRAIANKRRAHIANAPVNDLTAAQWQEIKKAQNYRCAHCQRTMKHLTMDHITPLSKGGSHKLHNIIAICKTCNSKKNTGESPVLVQPLLLTVAPGKPKT